MDDFALPEGTFSKKVLDALGLKSIDEGLTHRLDARFAILEQEQEQEVDHSIPLAQKIRKKLGSEFSARFGREMKKRAKSREIMDKYDIAPPKDERPTREPSKLEDYRQRVLDQQIKQQTQAQQAAQQGKQPQQPQRQALAKDAADYVDQLRRPGGDLDPKGINKLDQDAKIARAQQIQKQADIKFAPRDVAGPPQKDIIVKYIMQQVLSDLGLKA